MGDRRSSGARRATGRLLLTGALVDGKLINLGPGGFAIETGRGLRVGEYYELAVRSESGTAPAIPCGFAGRVRWCALRSTVKGPDGEVLPVYRAGFERSNAQGRSKDTGFIDFSPPST